MWPFIVNSNSNSNSNDNNDDDSNDDEHQTLTNIVTGCSTSNHTDYLSHDADTWVLLQEAHDRVKSQYAKNWHTSGRSRAAQGGTSNIPHTGMMVPFEVKANRRTRQRELHVTQDVPKGTQLWQPLHFHTIRSEHGYIEFLQELPHHLQCDALSWTHASWHDNEMYVDITLDDGTFIQSATTEEPANIDVDCVAVRDIKAGEIIYMNQTEYIPSTSSDDSPSSSPSSFSDSAAAAIGVEWFDDIRSTAWKRTGLGMGSSSSNRHNQQQHGIIAPSMAVLSAMYFVLKLFRGGKSTTSSSYDDYYDDTSFYNNNNKAKIS